MTMKTGFDECRLRELAVYEEINIDKNEQSVTKYEVIAMFFDTLLRKAIPRSSISRTGKCIPSRSQQHTIEISSIITDLIHKDHARYPL
jgi:hypothetical protein